METVAITLNKYYSESMIGYHTKYCIYIIKQMQQNKKGKITLVRNCTKTFWKTGELPNQHFREICISFVRNDADAATIIIG